MLPLQHAFSILILSTTPALYKKTPRSTVEMNKIMFRPNSDVLIDVCGLPDQYNKKTDTKLTVVMCPHILIGSP